MLAHAGTRRHMPAQDHTIQHPQVLQTLKGYHKWSSLSPGVFSLCILPVVGREYGSSVGHMPGQTGPMGLLAHHGLEQPCHLCGLLHLMHAHKHPHMSSSNKPVLTYARQVPLHKPLHKPSAYQESKVFHPDDFDAERSCTGCGDCQRMVRI